MLPCYCSIVVQVPVSSVPVYTACRCGWFAQGCSCYCCHRSGIIDRYVESSPSGNSPSMSLPFLVLSLLACPPRKVVLSIVANILPSLLFLVLLYLAGSKILMESDFADGRPMFAVHNLSWVMSEAISSCVHRFAGDGD